MKLAAMLLALSLAPAVVRAEYKLVLRGGATYWMKRKPVEKNGAYVFTATDGTLLSVRASDVSSLGAAEAPRVESVIEEPTAVSPVEAARRQHALEDSLKKRPRNVPQPTDAYRPGVGTPYMPGQNDYVVGKTWAPPTGSAVYSGAAPTSVTSGEPPAGVISGDAPLGAPSVGATSTPVAPPAAGETPGAPPTEVAPPTEAAPPTPAAPPTAPPPPSSSSEPAEPPPPPPPR
jgi:hypothetical protein